MSSSVRIAGSLWSVPAVELETRAHLMAAAGLRRWHWDHADGTIGPAGGFSAETADRLTTATGLLGEAHLMVADPLPQIAQWLPVCDTIIVHVEAAGHGDAVELIRRAERTAVVAISPGTPLSELDGLPGDVGVLVMSVAPGRAGSSFHGGTWQRLQQLRGRSLLGVDGSVTRARATECLANGANWIVSGTDLCGSPDPGAWLAGVQHAEP